VAGCAGLKVRSCGRCDRRATFVKNRHKTGPCGTASKHAGYSPNQPDLEVPSRDTFAGICTQEIILIRLAEYRAARVLAALPFCAVSRGT